MFFLYGGASYFVYIKFRVMSKEELVEFLKENLKIEFDTTRECYCTYPCVTIKLCDEVICSATNYEMEIVNN
jgi:hypothetical protein